MVAPCVADVNGDGAVDVLDADAHLARFRVGDLGADLNADGSLDFFDVAVFVAAVRAGC